MVPQTDLISVLMAKNFAQLALTPKPNPEPKAPELEVKQDRSQSAKPSTQNSADHNPLSPPVNSHLTEERLNAIREELRHTTPATATATATASSGPSRPCPLTTPELRTRKGKKKGKKDLVQEDMLKAYKQYKADKLAAYDNLLKREEEIPEHNSLSRKYQDKKIEANELEAQVRSECSSHRPRTQRYQISSYKQAKVTKLESIIQDRTPTLQSDLLATQNQLQEAEAHYFPTSTAPTAKDSYCIRSRSRRRQYFYHYTPARLG